MINLALKGTKAANDPRASSTLTDVPSELPKYNPFRRMLSRLYCPTVKSSMAYAFVDTATQKRVCYCACPPGMTLVDGSYCKRDIRSLANCGPFGDSAYIYEIKRTDSSNTVVANGCSVSKLHSQFGFRVPSIEANQRTEEDDGVLTSQSLRHYFKQQR